jgi:diguanylate cyclase (GGDEF)-like protein
VGVVFGVGLLLYARVNSSLVEIKSLGLGFILISCGFLLLGIRHFVPEWISVITSNLLVASGFFYTGLGVLKFLNYDTTQYSRLSSILGSALVVAFIYFTYIFPSINSRIFAISLFISILSFYYYYSIRSIESIGGRLFLNGLILTYLFMGVLFLLRGIFSFIEVPITDFMHAGIWHGLSFLSFELMFIVIAMAISGISNARLSADLETQATIDPLTGLYNRRALNQQALLDLERCKRNGSVFSIMLIDIDYFKSINDTYGHQVGDNVLIELADWLKSKIRSSDFAARFGGEEFVILLNDIDKKLLSEIAIEICNAVAKRPFLLDESGSKHLTISVGVASSEELNLDWSQLLSLADKRLYKAKENGRNQVVFE